MTLADKLRKQDEDFINEKVQKVKDDIIIKVNNREIADNYIYVGYWEPDNFHEEVLQRVKEYIESEGFIFEFKVNGYDWWDRGFGAPCYIYARWQENRND